MTPNDEFLTDAYTSLGLLRAARQTLESASPQAPNAREAWHKALKLVEAAVTEQWKYVDLCVAEYFPQGKPTDGPK